MKNFILWILGISVTLILIILINGQIAGPYFKFESTARFDVGQDLLWTVMNNIDEYKKNKNNVISLDKKEFIGDSVSSWIENYHFGIKKKY